MPITIEAIQQRRARCVLPYLDDSVRLDYLAVPASELGQADFDTLKDACTGKTDTEAKGELAIFLLRVLVGWDVTAGGEPYPLTKEALVALDSAFLGVCIAAIVQHANQGKVSGELLSELGIDGISPRADDESSPAMNRVTRRIQARAPSRRKLSALR